MPEVCKKMQEIIGGDLVGGWRIDWIRDRDVFPWKYPLFRGMVKKMDPDVGKAAISQQ